MNEKHSSTERKSSGKNAHFTLYIRPEDKFLMEEIDDKAFRERRSRSSVVMSIIEKYFRSDDPIEKVLIELGLLSISELKQALSIQQNGSSEKTIQQVLLDEGFVSPAEMERVNRLIK